MAPLPRRSPGLLLSGPATSLAKDLVAAKLHRLNPTARALLAACDGRTDEAEAVAAWSAETGVDREVIAADVAAALADFADRGLVGRSEPPAPPRRLNDDPGADRWPHQGRVHPVVGHAIRFSGPDPDLIALVDDHLGPGLDIEPTRRFTIRATDTAIVVVADAEWPFADLPSLLDQLTNAVNEYGHESAEVVALHSAAVVAPTGATVVLPAVPGGGKSTLTGHLISRGWGYLGDEAIGVRHHDLAALPYPKPLALDGTSRAVLGLPPTERWNTAPGELRRDVVIHATTPGPIDVVVLPTYRAGAAFETEQLCGPDALAAIVEHALNLPATGQPGMDALDRLATTVPVHRVVHSDLAAVEAWLLDVAVTG